MKVLSNDPGIPGYDEFEKTGYENGALGVCISGSGSTILGFSVTESEQLQKAWRKKTKELNIQARVISVGCDNTGVNGEEQNSFSCS